MKKILAAVLGCCLIGRGMALSVDPNVTHIKTEANSLSAVARYAHSFNASDAKQVCLVYDIDNTLLTAEPSFGGDAWAIWQNSLKAGDHNRVTHWLSAGTMGDFEGALRYFMNYRPVESATPAIVADLQQQYPSMALTARSFDQYYPATKRALMANAIDFSKHPIAQKAFDNTLLELNTKGDAFKMYYNGVYYAAGDDKGLTLLNFIRYQRQLSANPRLCAAVVFVDDNPRNVEAVAQALDHQLAFVAIHLTTIEANNPVLWRTVSWSLDSPHSQAQDFYAAIQTLKFNRGYANRPTELSGQ